MTQNLGEAVDRLAAETAFSGVVRVDVEGSVEFARAYGMADRAHGVANTVDTRFGVASGNKGLTALTVVSLVEDGLLQLATTARSVLGDDLLLIADDVTVEHLLAHRSGIGDYLDEETDAPITDYALSVAPHELATTESYLSILDGHPTVFAADERFAYNNGGYVVLALIAERVSGVPFHDLVAQRVCAPAGMLHTEFLRSDELPGDAATGYLFDDGLRTNMFHLPVRGTGDGGIYTTAADVHSLWWALFAGEIVPDHRVAEMIRPRSDAPTLSRRYGLGFWLLETSDVVYLEGYDAGASFRSVHDPSRAVTHTVLSNTSEGTWPITRYLGQRFGHA